MKRHESRLEATEMTHLRSVVGVTRNDRVRNACEGGSETR